jgi:hypothetical protein
LVGTAPAAVVVACAGAMLVAWIPVLRHWLARPGSLAVTMYAGGRADEVPRAVELRGVEEPVEVERSWREQRAGARLLCFRVRLPDGTRLELSREEGDDRWRLDRELPG